MRWQPLALLESAVRENIVSVRLALQRRWERTDRWRGEKQGNRDLTLRSPIFRHKSATTAMREEKELENHDL
ncbi:hypothetical protein L484_009991 [Morus notabilis]|uniref:Uncharacterized protein n=1 Tax=Morus notabilis TaxID=981085 RepID=W9QFY4_9ROSA|nr:hypothetical protein L484_009991 [Morus notabilis]